MFIPHLLDKNLERIFCYEAGLRLDWTSPWQQLGYALT